MCNNPCKQDQSVARIHGGKALRGTVEISGSKHSALHILGAALLAGGEVVIDHFPLIGDALNFLSIYESMGVVCSLQGPSLVLSVTPGEIRFDQSRLHLVPKLRSSVLLLGSLLLRNRRLKMPIPGGDKIDPHGRRGIDEFLRVLDLFGIRHQLHGEYLEAWLDGELEGDREIDLGRPDLFWFPTGNNRTALAMILAAGNRGRTRIRSALRAAEIVQLGEFLLTLGYPVKGLGTDTIAIQGNGAREAPDQSVRVALYPDKCEIVFWIVAACLTHGNLVLRLPEECSGYSLADFGPLYRIHETILVEMNIRMEKIGDREFRIDASGAHFRGMDLILDYLETEFTGKVMDASPYFIPLMCVAEGDSRYLDGKFGSSRVSFTRELNKLGANIHVDGGGMAHIRGGRQLRGNHIWCEAGDIRGAGALLLALLAAEGDNRLAGLDILKRANDYVPKLIQLGCDIEFVECGAEDDLALGNRFRIRKVTLLGNGALAVDFEERAPIVFDRSIPMAKVLCAAFAHPDLCGIEGLTGLLSDIARVSWTCLEIDCLSLRTIEVRIFLRDEAPTQRSLTRNPEKNPLPAGLAEYLEIRIGGNGYFAGRCLSPVRFEEWRARIAEVVSSPENTWIPLTVTIGITDQCNFDCDYCFSRGKERIDSLPGEALVRLIDQLADAGVRAVRFVGGGEATIHPDFVAALLLARARGLGTFLITNGSRMHLMPGILAGCLDSIRVSIQCAAPAFDLALEGIRQVNSAGSKNGARKRPLLGASYVVTGHNPAGMIAAARELKSAGADYLLFKKAHGIELGAQSRMALEKDLKTLISMLQDDSFRIVPELFDYEAPALEAGYYQGPAGCLLHHLRVVIQPNGDVLTCNRKGDAWFARIGNIHRSSFLEIMHGEERKQATALRRRAGSICPDCLFKDAHLLISRVLKEHPGEA